VRKLKAIFKPESRIISGLNIFLSLLRYHTILSHFWSNSQWNSDSVQFQAVWPEPQR